MCGEQESSFDSKYYKKGSPPRVRGTERNLGALDALEGITPACAGNSSYMYKCLLINWDHPRVCGEQFLKVVVYK